MTNEKLNLQVSDEEKCKQAEAEFNQYLAECSGEDWSQALCPSGCVVEPDGEYRHGCKSAALELGLI